MELKKNPRSDLKKWSSTFTNLGLVLSISALLVAFEWKAYDDFQLKDFNSSSEIWDMPEIPITIQAPPPPPEQAPEITIKLDDEKIDKIEMIIDIDAPINTPLPVIELTEPPIIDDPDEIKDFVEKQASFKGGMEAWYAYLKKTLYYPSQARRMGIEGTVIVRFIVNTDGSIQNVEVLRGIGGGCDEIAKNVIENSPNWNPGISKDRPVRSRMTMPIRFRLD
jgi:periplasmic protein TonB